MNKLYNVFSKLRYRFTRRFNNRLKPLLKWSTIWNWEYESCERCGSCFRLAYAVKDEVWDSIYGSSGGCFCINCLVEVGEEKGVVVKPEDFEWLMLFNGDNPSFDLIPFKEK